MTSPASEPQPNLQAERRCPNLELVGQPLSKPLSTAMAKKPTPEVAMDRRRRRTPSRRRVKKGRPTATYALRRRRATTEGQPTPSLTSFSNRALRPRTRGRCNLVACSATESRCRKDAQHLPMTKSKIQGAIAGRSKDIKVKSTIVKNHR